MRMSHSLRCGPVIGLLLGTVGASAQEETPKLTIEAVALAGGVAPGTDFVFDSFTPAFVNASGMIVFEGSRDRATPGNFAGIWTSVGGATTLVALNSDDAVGFPEDIDGDLPFLGGFGPSTINGQGDVAFTALPHGGGGPAALYHARARDQLTLIAGGPTEVSLDSSARHKLDGNGNVVFFGFDSLTIYRGASSAALSVIAAVGQQAPDIPGDVKFESFSDFVVSSSAGVAFQARLQGTDVGTNDQAIFKETGGVLGLVVREGDPIPDDPNGRNFEALITGLDGLEPPGINNLGEVVFKAFTPSDPDDQTNTSIWKASASGRLSLIVNAGVVTPTATGNVTFVGFGDPLINTAGNIVFQTVDSNSKAGIWKRSTSVLDELEPLIESGNAAPGTDAVFSDFARFVGDEMALNKDGHIAFVGYLDFDSPGVTEENRRGLWAQDPDGKIVLIVREDTTLQTADGVAKTVRLFEFVGGSGNADGRPSGFSDNGDVVFQAIFTDDAHLAPSRGVFRASFEGPPEEGTGFFWGGDAGDSNWHTVNGEETNWNDSQGNTVDPPGEAGTESVEITLADVVIDARAVSIFDLTVDNTVVTSLTVRKPLTLAFESQINGLNVFGDLTTNGKLTLAGATEWHSGTISTGTTGSLIQTSLFLVESSESPDGLRKITGTNPFENGGIVTQKADVDIVNGKIENKPGGTWRIFKGNLTATTGEGTFINRDTLIKPQGQETEDSSISTFFEAHARSLIEVQEEKLTLERGAEFLDDCIIITHVLGFGDTEVTLAATAGSGLYRVASGKKLTIAAIADDVDLSFEQGFVRLADEAILNIESDAECIVEDGAAFLLDGGTIIGSGLFNLAPTSSLNKWIEGVIGSTDIGAASAKVLVDDTALFIETDTPKVLAGTLTVQGSKGLVFQDIVDLLIDGGKVEVKDGTWRLHADASISATNGGTFGLTATGNKAGTLEVTATKESTFSAPLDNSGIVDLKQGTLKLTGEVNQITGTSLLGGTWKIRSHRDSTSKAVLEIPDAVISVIGEKAEVLLGGTGSFPQLMLRTVSGEFTVDDEATFETPSDLTNRGTFTVAGVSSVKVNGRFANEGVFELDEGSLDVDEFETGSKSKTTIFGELSAPTVRVNGGKFHGSGTINTQKFDNKGQLLPGDSPGAMTITGDYTQFPEGRLVIEIGGTAVETEHDQLIVNGSADLSGTLILKFIDDFAPRAGQTFDFLEVEGTITGGFDAAETVDLAAGFEFEVSSTAGKLTMTAITDGVYSGILGAIADVTAGPSPPPDESAASPGDADVPMLQFDVSAEAAGLSISSLTLTADGSGNDAVDVGSVNVWLDANGNGQADEGELQVAAGTYQADDTPVTLPIDPPVEVSGGESVTMLITYDLAGDSSGADKSGVAGGPRNHAAPPQEPGPSGVVVALLLPSILLFGAGYQGQARRHPRTLFVLSGAAVIVVSSLWFSGCVGGTAGSGGAGGDVRSSPSYRTTLTAIGAKAAEGGEDASAPNLSLTGTMLTVGG